MTLRALALMAALAAMPAPAVAAPAFESGHGISVEKVEQLSPRHFEVALRSSVVDGPLHVRVLLPAAYDERPRERWPVLYLFHGTSGGASDWVVQGDAEKTTAGSGFITVMPDAGIESDGGGYCTNWFNAGKRGKPMWETFEIDQVVPWVDANLRTRARREGRAIYGLSQGGFCSFSLAARHPDMFGSAGSYSGAIDTSKDAEARVLMTPIVQATATLLGPSDDPDAIFGPRTTQEVNWAASDPATLVENMRGMSLYAYTGDGRNGPLDPPGANPGGSAIEAGVHRLTELWKANADAAQIPVELHDYGAGTHTWPYWARDLRESIEDLERDFAAPRPAPAQKFYMSADATWSQWGYDVEMRRPAREFSTLRDADADGFTLLGSGIGVVLTPAAYEPGASAKVRVGGGEVRSMRVRDDGRLRVEVPLGPGNPYQQFTAEAEATGGTKVFSARVSIDAPRAAPSRSSANSATFVSLSQATGSPRRSSISAPKAKSSSGRWTEPTDRPLRRSIVLGMPKPTATTSGAPARSSSAASQIVSRSASRVRPAIQRSRYRSTSPPSPITPPRSFVPPASKARTRGGGIEGRYTPRHDEPPAPARVQGLPLAAQPA